MKKLRVMIVLIFIAGAAHAQHTLTKLMESDTVLAKPESVLADTKNHILYSSQIAGDVVAKDGVGGVALLTLDGKVTNLNWVTGLNAPKGMGLHNGKLYVADVDELVVIDTKSAKVDQKIAVPGSGFLNDITIDPYGVVYVSDTRANKVFRVENGKSEMYLDNMITANGVKFYNDNLYVGAGKVLYKVDKTKNITKVVEDLPGNIDGLENLKNGDFIVSGGGFIVYIKSTGEKEVMLNTENKISTADFSIDLDKNIIYVPTLNGKRVIAYTLK